MYIEKLLKRFDERYLSEFATNCGLELEDYRICGNSIKVKLVKPFSNFVVSYNLFDYHIEEIGGITSIESKENLPIIQNEWRKYLGSKFGNSYVLHFNTWLDNQKMPFYGTHRFM